MLLTKSIYDPKETHDGTRVLVTRYYPRGVKREHFDDWMQELAPSNTLLKLYKQGRITSKDFTIQYQIEISNEDAQQAMFKLKQDSNVKNVTILCYEPEGKFCHRCILKKVVLSGCLKPKDADYHE